MAEIPYDSLTAHAVLAELNARLLGGQVQRVVQPAPLELALGIYARGAQLPLLLNCEAEAARAHLLAGMPRGPAQPPAFCMLLRKHLEGARLVEVVPHGFDRVFSLLFSADGALLRLVVELSGRHSNLVLVNQEGIVVDALKRISHRLNRVRETLPGRPYQPPPVDERKPDPLNLTLEEVLSQLGCLPEDQEAVGGRLLSQFRGLSPFLATELAQRIALHGLAEAWDQVFGAARRGDWQPVTVLDAAGSILGAYPLRLVSVPAHLQREANSLSAALDAAYRNVSERAERDASARRLRSEIQRNLKALRRQQEELRRAIAEGARAEEYRQSGELLLANGALIAPESSSVRVPDFYSTDGGTREIALDPSLGPSQNAERYFRRARRAEAAAERAATMLERVEEQLEALAGALNALEVEASSEQIERLRQALLEVGALRQAQIASAPPAAVALPSFGGKKIRRTERDGWIILYGENAEANDYLTRRVAAPDDLWLHVRAGSGAHVVVRAQGKEVPRHVVEHAAAIAVRNSASRHASVTPVAVTLRKHVRRPRGGAPGAVIYQNEKTLMVERHRVEALG